MSESESESETVNYSDYSDTYQNREKRITDMMTELMRDEILHLLDLVEQKDKTILLLKQSLISRDKFMIKEGCYDKYLGLERVEGKREND